MITTRCFSRCVYLRRLLHSGGLVKKTDTRLSFRKDEVKKYGVSDEVRKFIEEQMKNREKLDLVEKRSIENPEQNLVQVEGIPKDWAEGDVLSYFDPKLKLIQSASHMLNKFGQPNGKVVLLMRDRESASKFIEKYNNDYIELKDMTSPIRARLFDLQTKSTAFKAEKLERTLMIYDLAFEATNKDLVDLCKDYGEIKSLYMPMRTATKNKGYCVVEFENQSSVHSMMFMCKGMSLFGRELKFKTGNYLFAKSVPKKTQETPNTKSSLILEKAEKTEVKIKNTLNDLIDAEIADIAKQNTESK